MEPQYQESIERHYDAILGLLTHFITKLADEAVEMAARGVALAAPLPNAISMYNITQRDLGWNWTAAFAFALSMEVVVFLLVEIALMQWDGYLNQPRRYKLPFIIMGIVVVVGVAVVMGFVYMLETHKIMAALPIVSLCSFVGIGLKRWHERNVITRIKGSDSRVIRKSKSDSQNHSGITSESVNQISDYEKVILDYYSDSPLASQRKAATDLGISQAKISKTLTQLESIGMIHRNGNGVEILENK